MARKRFRVLFRNVLQATDIVGLKFFEPTKIPKLGRYYDERAVDSEVGAIESLGCT